MAHTIGVLVIVLGALESAHADYDCGGGMHVANVGLQMDEKVMDISGDWDQGCNSCGQYLEDHKVNGFCAGWYCEKVVWGIWLKRDGSKPCPSPPQPKECTVTNVEGSWKGIAFASVSSTFKVSEGVTHGYTNQTTSSWAHSVQANVSAGFAWGPFKAAASVSGATSRSMANSYSNIFLMTVTTEFDYNLQPGELWQFQFAVEDSCGNSVVMGQDIVQTDSKVQQPCCLPGYFADPSKPAGDCVAEPGDRVYNLCTSTLAMRELPSSSFVGSVDCGSGMTVDSAGSVMDAQVMNIVGDWEQGCALCGQNLQARSLTCAGWYCKKAVTGIWLKRDSTQPPCGSTSLLVI